MAITSNLLPKCLKGHDTQMAKPNTWQRMEQARQFIDSIDTTGGEMDKAAKFNLLVSSVPSPWARVHLTQHAIMPGNEAGDTRTLTQFYAFMRSEWRGLIAAYVLYPEDFELTAPIDLVSKDMTSRSGQFDILSTYSEMLFENAPLWKHQKGKNENPKMQLLYYHNGDRRFVIGGTSPFSILFSGMNYTMPDDDQRIYWINGGKLQDPASREYETFYKEGGAKYNDKHFNNLKKLYSFLNGIQKNSAEYVNTLKSIWDTDHDLTDQPSTTDARYHIIGMVLNGAVASWMDDIKDILGEAIAEKAKNIPVNHKRPEGPLGQLLDIKAKYYWRNGIFYTKPNDPAITMAEINDVVVDNVESLFIDSDYLAGWRDCAVPSTDNMGRATSKMENDYRMSPVHFLTANDEQEGKTWFFAVPFSEFALRDVFKQEFESIIKGANKNVIVKAEMNGKRVDVYLKARIDGEGEWVNIRNRSFNIEVPNSTKKVFAWPNFCSAKWQKYYYYSEFPTNATTDVQMVPVFDEIADIEDNNVLSKVSKEAFLKMVKYPAAATSDTHAYEIIRTNKPLRRIKIRKRIGNSVSELGWLVLRRVQYCNPDEPQGIQVIRDTDTLSGTTVGFDFGSTNSCAYYSGQGANDIRPVPFSNRRLAIIGFDNKPVFTAEPNELLFISNEEPRNKNGQIKSWLHEHDQMFIDTNMMGEELIGGVPVNETNITVKSMTPYEITTNAGKLHYNMKWLVDSDGSRRKAAFVKMVWIQICADLFAEGLYPKTLNWSYPSAMGANDMGALESIYADIPSPCPDYRLDDREKFSFTEAEAVCSYFLDKRIALEDYKLFVGIDIGGSTSDILVLGKDTQDNCNEQPQVVKPAKQQPMPQAAPAIDYNEYGRGELADMAFKRGLATMDALDDMGRKEIVELLKTSDSGQPNYQDMSRSELCKEVRRLGLEHLIDLEEVSRSQIVEFLMKHSGTQSVDYKSMSRKELCDLVRQRGLEQLIDLEEAGKTDIIDFLKAHETAAPPKPVTTAATEQRLQTRTTPTARHERGKTDRRLYTQCSVRMAAGVFFDAIIDSKKFRDCIRNFHASRATDIKVEDIDSIEVDKLRAPYYLNNIFDQLHGDQDFKKFYGFLKSDVPFVFTLPAYIVGALMAYSGMLVRNAIITQRMDKVEEVHFRYFGKGGRLFEWLFFTFKKEEVEAYLDACFEVGIKNRAINEALHRNEDFAIKCIYDNCDEDNYGCNENSENKSEVARGLVSRHEITGIQPNRKNIYGKRNEKAKQEYDARKQEVIGEVGIKLNGVEQDELSLVDDNFYESEGAISLPRTFQNFDDFMNIFLQFVGRATPIYTNTNRLQEKIDTVSNVRNFIVRDPEYKKYLNNIINNNDDSYRMPVFIATALYYLEEVLLKEVFATN